MYDAKEKLVRAAHGMANKVVDEELTQALRRTASEGRVERLQGVFNVLGREPRRMKCDGITAESIEEVFRISKVGSRAGTLGHLSRWTYVLSLLE